MELTLHDGSHFHVQLTQPQLEELELTEGQNVWVKPGPQDEVRGRRDEDQRVERFAVTRSPVWVRGMATRAGALVLPGAFAVHELRYVIGGRA